MKKILVFSILLSFIFSCSKPTDKDDDIPKNPREYEWEFYSIKFFEGQHQIIMNNIWGSDPNNVYISGHNSINAGHMWHFDGEEWKEIKLPSLDYGEKSLDGDLHGISENNIWAAGHEIYRHPNPPPNFLDSSLVFHFNGSNWEICELDEKDRMLTTVFALSENEVWAAGLFDAFYKFDGARWIKTKLNYNFPECTNRIALSMSGSTDYGLYMTMRISSVKYGMFYYLFHYHNSLWSAVDSTRHWVKSYRNLWLSPSGKLYVCGDVLRIWDGSSWSIEMEGLTFTHVFGTADDNVFLIARDYLDGIVYHFNGTDWKRLENINTEGIQLDALWTDGEEVFIVGERYNAVQKVVVLHGK